MSQVVTPGRPAPPQASAGTFTKLAAVAGFVKRAAGQRWLRRLAVALAVATVAVIVLWRLFRVVVGIATNKMWFDSVQHGSVYTTVVEAQIVLFCVFGALAGLIGGLTLLAVRRIQPRLEISQDDDTFRWLFRKYEPRVWRLLLVLAVIIPAVLVGSRAAGRWQTYLMWRHATPWHATDPLFHKDISFFVEINPFHVLAVSLLTQAVTYGLWIAVISGYWYGAWRIRRGPRKITRGLVALLSVMLAGYLVLRAVRYWLSRYAYTTSPTGSVTGASYTNVHAGVPSRGVLTVVILLCAAALFANGVLAGRVRQAGRLRWALAPLLVAALAVGVVGTAWPSLVLRYRETPSAAKLDLGEVRHNQQATRAAFGLDGDVTTVPYHPSTTVTGPALDDLARSSAQISLLDPNALSPTFNVEQQLQAYYGFKSTLDVDHYDIDGHQQDVDLAVRELRTGNIPHSSWVFNHLVYTHGYGVVAAPTTEVDPKTQNPVFLDGGMPPAQQIPVSRPQVYFGPAFSGSSYAIVGRPAGSSRNVEFDHPGGNGSSKSAYTTWTGGAGIPVGSTLRRLLFAVRLGSPNILFSSELNSASKLLMVRDPRARVAKVAPWLTLDGDEYPVVVNGRIEWVVDGYTTTSNYPYSQLVNLRSATRTTLTANGASVAQPSKQVNYMQNSVKAVVDAYTGKVTLYEWNQQQHPDPLLKAWEGVFPGLVEPQSEIPSALLSQLRYPTDLFNVQRSLLAKYHVTQPASFYSGNDFWTVPNDPTASSGGSSVPLAARYMSLSPDGTGTQQYSLSSPMATLNGQQLAAYISVDAQPGPDYGKFTVLDFPSASGGESPAQVQNDIESNTTITKALTLQRGGKSNVVLGSLEAIPVAGRLLYVEPVYTQSSGSSSFPILRHVIALYGNGDPSFEDSLAPALREALASGTASP